MKQAIIDAICEYAESCVGTPYNYGCSVPGKGFDCSTFGIWPYKKAGLIRPGVVPPPEHRDWIYKKDVDVKRFYKFIIQFADVVNYDDRQPGDLVSFYVTGHAGKRIESHVGIIVKNDCVIHAASGHKVKRQRLQKVASLCAIYRAKGLIDASE